MSLCPQSGPDLAPAPPDPPDPAGSPEPPLVPQIPPDPQARPRWIPGAPSGSPSLPRAVHGALSPPAGPAGGDSGGDIGPGCPGCPSGQVSPAVILSPAPPRKGNVSQRAAPAPSRPVGAAPSGGGSMFPDEQGRDLAYCLPTSFFNLLAGEGRGLLAEGRTLSFGWSHRLLSQCSKRGGSHFSHWVIFRMTP